MRVRTAGRSSCADPSLVWSSSRQTITGSPDEFTRQYATHMRTTCAPVGSVSCNNSSVIGKFRLSVGQSVIASANLLPLSPYIKQGSDVAYITPCTTTFAPTKTSPFAPPKPFSSTSVGCPDESPSAASRVYTEEALPALYEISNGNSGTRLII